MKNEKMINTKKLGIWTFIWVLSTAFATFGPIFLWHNSFELSLFAIILNLSIGTVMIFANVKLFQSYDEFEKMIHLESMALTLGMTVVVGLSYSMLDAVNIIPFDAEIGQLVIFTSLFYLSTLIINQRRYR